ncbi:hypothetical protein Lfu02_29560 [Longispora fulva]|uniref:Uncharacterized protein n=1 Tax=Longispora fulva TaxID=619741 RepID=A0A8J7GJ63_9ACTN|nr:hypothetical protein [Longispora fulva]MBG6139091.1 hypothetical protein [Longispora fulva]GIG58584.1 hypothetical protein Lfu02_29560 [Longispora fulva]
MEQEEADRAAAVAELVAEGGPVAEIRKVAALWIPGLTAALGLFGLAGALIGKDTLTALPVWARITVGVLAGLAVLLAAGALFGAYRAAYGWPRAARSPQALLAWYQARGEEPGRIVAGFQRAVLATAGALLAMVVGVGLLWFVPPVEEGGTQIRVTRTDESDVCGAMLASVNPTSIRVRRASDGRVVSVPVAKIAAMTPAPKC